MFHSIEVGTGLWRSFYQVGPLVLVTTQDERGRPNVAPKTQVTRIGRGPFIGFGCTPAHHTYRNAVATSEFVVNYPGPELRDAVMVAGRGFSDDVPNEIAASGLTSIPSVEVRPPRIRECYAHLECRLNEIRGYGNDVFIVGQVVAAWVRGELGSLGRAEDALRRQPLLGYVYPDHYVVVDSASPVES